LKAPHHVEEGLLGRVCRVLRRVHEPQAKVGYPRFVAVVQGGEGKAVPRHGLLEEDAVRRRGTGGAPLSAGLARDLLDTPNVRRARLGVKVTARL
jgi:hypothetical protein